MREAHLLVFSHLIVQINVHKSQLFAEGTGSAEAGELQIAEPDLNFMELADNLGNLQVGA